MAKIRITENILKQIVAESVKKILKDSLNETQTLPNAITYNGDGENSEMWFEAGITMDDFVKVAEKAGIQMGMGVVVAVTVLLLITILVSVCVKDTEE